MSPILKSVRRLIVFALIMFGTFGAISASATSQSGFWGKLTWDTLISGEGETRFRYGNWYGPGWWGGSELDARVGALPPVDALDRVAQKHDFGYEIAEKLGRGNKRLEAHYKALADVIAVRDALALDSDPRRWNPPAKDPALARKYCERIALGFPNYQQRLNELKSVIPSRIDPSHPEALEWFVDRKPPLNENQLEALMQQRVDDWNQAYQKRKENKQAREDAKLPEWIGGAPLDNVDHSIPPAGKGGHWKLISSLDDDGSERAEAANAKNPDWRTTVAYSSGSSTIKLTYLGPTTHHTVPTIKGASIAFRMNWTAPPAIIQPGRPASMKVAVALAGRSHARPHMNGKAFVQIVRIEKDGKTPGSELGRFYNNIPGKPVNSWFESSSTNNYQSFDETVYGTLPKGSKRGDLVGIRVTTSNGGNGKTSTLYVYQWQS